MQPMVKCLPSILRRSSCQACIQDKLSLWIMRASMKEKKCGKRLKPKAVTCCFYRPIRPISRPLKRLSPSSKPFYVVSGHVLPKNFKKQLYMLYKKLLLMMLMDGFATVAMNSQLKKKSFRWDEPGQAFGEPLYHPENRYQRQESERFRAFSYEDLLKRDKLSLDLFWMRDEILEGTDKL